MGLPGAGPCEVLRAIECGANHEIECELVESKTQASIEESWQVRLTIARPNPSIALRKGRRGPWIASAIDVPSCVLEALGARESRCGAIESRRRWAAWLSHDWEDAGGRRLRSRSGEIIAAIRLPVARDAGASMLRMRISPVLDEDMTRIDPVVVPLPCRVGDLKAAIGRVRAWAPEVGGAEPQR